MANKLIIIPEQIYRGLTASQDTGDSLEFTKNQIEKIKRERLDSSRKNVKYNQELRRYLAIRNERENRPVRVDMPKGTKMLIKKGDEPEEIADVIDNDEGIKKRKPPTEPERMNLLRARAKGITPERRRRKQSNIPQKTAETYNAPEPMDNPIVPDSHKPMEISNVDEVFVQGKDEDPPVTSSAVVPNTVVQSQFPPKLWGGPGPIHLKSKRIKKLPYPKRKPATTQSTPIIEELIEPELSPPPPRLAITDQVSQSRPMEIDMPLVKRPNYRKKGYDPNLMEFLSPEMRYERLKRKALDAVEIPLSKKIRFHDPILALPPPSLKKGIKRKFKDEDDYGKNKKVKMLPTNEKKAIKGNTPLKAIMPPPKKGTKRKQKDTDDQPKRKKNKKTIESKLKAIESRTPLKAIESKMPLKAIEWKTPLKAIMPPPKKGTKRKQTDTDDQLERKRNKKAIESPHKVIEYKPSLLAIMPPPAKKKWATRKPTKFDTKKWAIRKPTHFELFPPF